MPDPQMPIQPGVPNMPINNPTQQPLQGMPGTGGPMPVAAPVAPIAQPIMDPRFAGGIPTQGTATMPQPGMNPQMQGGMPNNAPAARLAQLRSMPGMPNTQ